MRLAWALGACLLAISLLGALAPSSTGQPVVTPEVTFPDRASDQPVAPHRGPLQLVLNATIGCHADEVPGTVTRAFFNVSDTPAFASAVLAPSERNYEVLPGTCPDVTQAHEVNTTLFVNTRRPGTAAFTPFQVHVTLTVAQHEQATGEELHRHGPYHANVSLIQGYGHRYEMTLDERFLRAPANQSLVYRGQIDNRANGETRFQLDLQGIHANLTATVEPEELVLAAQDQGAFTVTVTPVQADPPPTDTYRFHLHATGAATDPRGGPVPNTTLDLVADVTPLQEESSPIPAPVPGLVVPVLLAAAGLVGRWR